ncbi:MAG: hypothetical protein ACUVUC_05825 [Thermoguttaceae bacterium]
MPGLIGRAECEHRVWPILAERAEMVVAAQRPAGRESCLRGLARLLLRFWALLVTGQRVPDANSGLRVFRHEAVLGFLDVLPDGCSFATTLSIAMLASGRKVSYQAVRCRACVGRSKVRLLHDGLGLVRSFVRVGLCLVRLGLRRFPATRPRLSRA